MKYVLTGEQFTAQQASDWGLVSEVVPAAELVDKAVAMASKIASFSKPVGMVRVGGCR